MAHTELQTFSFHGDRLATFKVDGVPHVAMRPIVEALGLSWGSQSDKLRGMAPRFNCTDIETVGADGRQRRMLAMPVTKLNLWLATINPNKVHDAAKRAKIELYQEESATALYDYWNKGVAVRDDYEGVVTDLGTEVRQVIGGIVKAVLHKELVELVPALVRSEIATSSMAFRLGRTAGQIWREHGFPPIKVTSWFSNRLCQMGCQIEGGGRGELGGRTCKLFDPDKAERWIKNGGRQLVETYISERKGQGQLRLVA